MRILSIFIGHNYEFIFFETRLELAYSGVYDKRILVVTKLMQLA